MTVFEKRIAELGAAIRKQDQRIAELEQENKALRRTVPHKLWEKHAALLERLEQRAQVESDARAEWLRETIKEARDG